jgi:hypothetical protein
VRFPELLGRDPDLVHEVCAALGSTCFFVVRAAAGDGTPQLLLDVLAGRVAR